jgi:hypothetical protein
MAPPYPALDPVPPTQNTATPGRWFTLCAEKLSGRVNRPAAAYVLAA